MTAPIRSDAEASRRAAAEAAARKAAEVAARKAAEEAARKAAEAAAAREAARKSAEPSSASQPAPPAAPQQGASAPASANVVPVAGPPQNRPQGPVPAPPRQGDQAGPIAPDRKARIDGYVRNNATAENRTLGVIYDSDGGSRVGRALRGDSELGRLDPVERDYLAKASVTAWAGQADEGRSNENVDEAIAEAGKDPAAKQALARALAEPVLSQERNAARGVPSMASPEFFRNTSRMFNRALETDARSVLQGAEGAEAGIASRSKGMSEAAKRNVWSALADRGAVPARVQERLTSAMLVMEDRGFANGNRDNHRLIGAAVANARRPGDSDQDRVARTAIAGNVERALNEPGARDMLFDPEIRPDLRMWAMGQVASEQGCVDGRKFADGWESEAISKAYAREVNDPFRGRGTGPQTLGGEALRNTVGQAMGYKPDQLPAELTPQFLANGLNNKVYSSGDANKPIDAVASRIRELGGEQAQVSVVPVTITSKDQGAATVPLFRVETAGGPKFVDHNGDRYDSVKHWEETNKLPEGKMTYAEGLDLKTTTLTTRNTPGVVDSFGEGFGKVMDGVAIGAGIVAAGAAIFFSGGTATPFVVAGGTAIAGGWGAARAGQQLHDLQSHGRDLGDLSDPDVRSAWLNMGASVLSVGAAGSAAKIATSGARVSPGAARAVAGTQILAEGADAASMVDATVQTAQNWDRMNGSQRAEALLNVAFWGGMTVAAGRAGGHRGADAVDFPAMARRLETGTGFPMSANPDLRPGEIAVRYDMGADGRTSGVRIEYGGPTPPDRASVMRHDIAAQQVAAAGGLTDRLQRLVPGGKAPVGSEAWEAGIEIGKMQREAKLVSDRLAGTDLTPQERAALESRQIEIGNGLAGQRARLDAWETAGTGSIADASRGVNQAQSLGWPGAPDGYSWVAGSDGTPHLRRQDTDLARLDYDPATRSFTERPEGPASAIRVGHGHNEITWTMDERGNLTRAEGTLREFHRHADRSSAETTAQRDAAAKGKEGDQGGHAIGHRFVLDQGLKNLFPQDANFNMGAYRSFEDELANWIQRGYDVKVKVEPREHDATGRPATVGVSYTVIDPATGKTIDKRDHVFTNGPNQVYAKRTEDYMNQKVRTAG